MKLSKLLPTCFLALGLSLSIAGCDDGDDGETTDTNAESNETNDTNNETTGADDVTCATLCTNFVELCIQMGKSTEFETNDQCVEACGAWDQDGVNCRNEQIIADACDQAGNMGSTCQ